jgi:hypothetical protein
MRNKYLIFLCTISLFQITNIIAQITDWDWASKSGGINSDVGRSVTTDANGNVYVTGFFKSVSITFGTTVLYNLDNSGITNDLFLVKYDANGNVLWARKGGGANDDTPRDIATDASGNVFITGCFDGSITFGTTTLTNPGGVFLVKYNTNGDLIWARAADGISPEQVFGVAADANGNVFITGNFRNNTISFGDITLTNTTAGSNPILYDIFVVKYDGDGNVLWAKSEGGTGEDYARGVAVDPAGRAYVTGQFVSSAMTFNSSTLTNSGSSDIFLLVYDYDATGSRLYAKSVGGANGDNSLGISVALNSSTFSFDILLTGTFSSPSITFGSTTLINSGGSDFFVAKFNNLTSDFVWAKSGVNAINDDFGRGISTDSNGNVYVTGYFGSALITFGETTLVNAGATDLFVVKYDINGNELWAKSAGGLYDDQSFGIASENNGNVYITGYYGSSSITFGNTTLTNTGNVDMFIAKLNECFLPNNSVSQNGITLTATETGASYQWLDCNNENAPISGSTSQSYTATENGSYAVEITKNGCTAISTCINITSVGIEEFEQIRFNVYPNPSSDNITIKLNQQGKFTLQILDMAGKIVADFGKVKTDNQIYDIRHLSNGIYIVRLEGQGSTAVEKLIKQ